MSFAVYQDGNPAILSPERVRLYSGKWGNNKFETLEEAVDYLVEWADTSEPRETFMKTDEEFILYDNSFGPFTMMIKCEDE